MHQIQRSKTLWILFFITPGLMVVGVFILLPLFMSLFNSLFSWRQLVRLDFVGLDNFKRLLTTFPYQERFFAGGSRSVRGWATGCTTGCRNGGSAGLSWC